MDHSRRIAHLGSAVPHLSVALLPDQLAEAPNQDQEVDWLAALAPKVPKTRPTAPPWLWSVSACSVGPTSPPPPPHVPLARRLYCGHVLAGQLVSYLASTVGREAAPSFIRVGNTYCDIAQGGYVVVLV
jgi:hypothetical protein